jgi:hypothetical protein
VGVERLDNIVARNQRALRDTKHKLLWVGVIVAALIAVAIGVSMGFGQPKHTARTIPAPAPEEHDHVHGVLLRSPR